MAGSNYKITLRSLTESRPTKNMKKLTELTLSEQTLVKIVAKLHSIDPNSVDEFKEELTEEVIHYAKLF
jgi:DNA-directed RNA polymerase subunit F